MITTSIPILLVENFQIFCFTGFVTFFMSIYMDNVLLQDIILSQGQWSRSKSEGPNYEYEICVNVNGNHGDLAACTHKNSHFRSSEIDTFTM